MATIAEQLRTARVSNLQAQYTIVMTVTTAGDLPDSGAFLLEIVDADDPKDDTLTRVATVADLETYGLSRASAVRAGESFFRSPTITKFYDKVADAVAAKDFLKEKVNDLVTEYATYLADFKADPAESTSYPQTALGLLTPAITAYTDKVTERKAQEALVADMTDECTALTGEYTEALTAHTIAQQTLSAMQRTESTLQTMLASMQALKGESEDLVVDVVAALTVWSNVRGLMSPAAQVDLMDDELEPVIGRLTTQYYGSFQAALTTYGQDIALLDAELTTLTADIVAQTAVRDDAEDALALALTAKETCAREVAEAQQVLEALEREETVLLANVVALCPTYTP